ncbi:serine/threonine phosphatase [Almyronema epifaneia]|uniref:Serine/threonine phosphatase n=1 Tax=Almyronema epifaneia S1 TaxID=2991925 RepID=A0ABW6IAY9_9CYAN
MLTCSYCQFENPNSNKFCQNCGSPLKLLLAVVTFSGEQTWESSDEALIETSSGQAAVDAVPMEISKEAGTLGRVEAEESENALFTAAAEPTALFPSTSTERAAATVSAEVNATADLPEIRAESPLTLAPTPPALALPLPEELSKPYLDQDQRYQLKQPLSPTPFSHLEFEADVIDCQPAAPSPLAELAEQLLRATEQADNEAKEPSHSLTETLPDAAQPYLLLQSNFFPAVPELHCAWQTDSYTVLILEQRSQFAKLSEYWQLEAVEALQQIHWCYEMSELWQALAPYQGQPSLLNLENLRVDEDQILCLQRLYFQSADMQYTLRDLGLLWQIMLQQAPNALSDLITLASDLGAGNLETIETLQARLVAIADRLLQPEGTPQLSPAPQQEEALPTAAQPQANAEELANMEAAIAEASQLLLDTDTEDLLERIDEDNLTNDSPTMVLPMMLVELSEAGQTHVGQQREHNEDTFCIQSEICRLETPKDRRLQAKGLYILCDGMGGHESGEVASALAVESLQAYFSEHWQSSLPSEEEIKQAIAQANDVIYNTNQADERSGNSRMGTTLVMLLLQETHAVIAHVGDSRLYCYSRRLGLQQVTCDHEVGQREIQRGVEPAIAYARPDAYQLTQALGPRDSSNIRPSISFLEFSEDTVLLLCSDGLSDNDLLDTHVSSHIEPLLSNRTDLEAGLEQLINLANEQNGHDNITAIAISIKVKPNLDKLKKAS